MALEDMPAEMYLRPGRVGASQRKKQTRYSIEWSENTSLLH